MRGRYLLSTNENLPEMNIYADKSALVLHWLLEEGVKRKGFSIREVAREVKVSLGLVQRVFGTLIALGLIQAEGLRTSKRFFLKKSKHLLESWLEHYSLTEKCKMRTYRSGLSGRVELLHALKETKLESKVALALHSAAEAYGCKNTNLNTLELYILEPNILPLLEKELHLEPQEKGYDVLLIEPYYKSLLKLKRINLEKSISVSPALLTFLDLYHFPLRGQEQAEFMAERIPEIKNIYKLGP